ncbi:DUF4489 domain-containing protein [Clostridium sp.]|uniref:DUF4489 domain-containing protein n=1 Tax=Clostridium sp. TaxID=1506 RepID=UPI0025BBE3C6|nr:DUF4489 domain-containing protein [Clostridium sp.]
MNSNLRKHYGHFNDAKKEKNEKYCNPIIKCSCPRSVIIPEDTEANTIFAITSIEVDTYGLCNPRAKLNFTSNIVFRNFFGNLSIRVFKQCRNQLTRVPVGSEWTIILGREVAGITGARVISFFVCDQDLCEEDCCFYTVEVRVNSIIPVATIAFNNSSLDATIYCDNSCYINYERV